MVTVEGRDPEIWDPFVLHRGQSLLEIWGIGVALYISNPKKYRLSTMRRHAVKQLARGEYRGGCKDRDSRVKCRARGTCVLCGFIAVENLPCMGKRS